MKVVILAGGLGTRIAEETDIKPKPMVEIGGKPILWHIMETFAEQGFNDFVIALGYKGGVINSWLRDQYYIDGNLKISSGTLGASTSNLRKINDWNIETIDTGAETMTGGRIKRIMDNYPNERLLVTYGDGLANVDISSLIEFHQRAGRLATVTAVRPPARFGHLVIDGNHVSHFAEKNQLDVGWINGGYFILEPEVIALLSDDSNIFEKDTLPKIVDINQLAAFKHEGFWHGMDTLRDKQILEDLAKSNTPPLEIYTDLIP
jgi:glucose-1-phosphate cytidylyltransferase